MFVAGFPVGATEDQISGILGQYGNVMSVKILPSNMNKNDTAALIRMQDHKQAKWMVDNMNNSMVPRGLTGPITVRFANSQGAFSTPQGSYDKAMPDYSHFGRTEPYAPSQGKSNSAQGATLNGEPGPGSASPPNHQAAAGADSAGGATASQKAKDEARRVAREKAILFTPGADGNVPGPPLPLVMDDDGDEANEFLVEDEVAGGLRRTLMSNGSLQVLPSVQDEVIVVSATLPGAETGEKQSSTPSEVPNGLEAAEITKRKSDSSMQQDRRPS